MIIIIIMDKEKVANADDLPPGPLAGLRVLDQSGPLGNYCGKLFADLGADVILVESPDGTPLRHEPPFLGPGDAESIPFLYMNSGKRSRAWTSSSQPTPPSCASWPAGPTWWSRANGRARRSGAASAGPR